MVAPSVIEFVGGKEDGETGFDFVDVDLLELPKCLEEVESFDYDPDYGEKPHLTRVGTKGGRDVVVEIYFRAIRGRRTADDLRRERRRLAREVARRTVNAEFQIMIGTNGSVSG